MLDRKHVLLFSLTLSLILFLFSFRILSLPPGLETDEGSISYNSLLISKNLRDQNNRFLPFFILSSDKLDWKQPVLIYSSAIFFRIFGASLLAFKLVNIIFSLATSILIYLLIRLLIKDKRYALIGMLLYGVTPMIIITTRIGNESILPAFFGSLWLLLLTLYYKKNLNIYLFLGALALGIGFYCFKGMRIIIPVWSLLTIALIAFKNNFSKVSLKPIIIFSLTMAPFALIIPFLESKYPGAIFDRSSIPLESYRYFLHYWLANINVFSLFSQPDIGKIYEMNYFGALLISTLPFLIGGFYYSSKKPTYRLFILISFLLTPVLFGIAKSTSYSHRLTGIVPLYVLLSVYGLKFAITKLSHTSYLSTTLALASILVVLNFLDFFNYYYLKYPNLNSTRQAFSNNYYQGFKQLSSTASSQQLTPYIQSDIYFGHGDANRFYELAYFKEPLKIWKLGDPMPTKSVLLTQVGKLENTTTTTKIPSQDIYLQISP